MRVKGWLGSEAPGRVIPFPGRARVQEAVPQTSRLSRDLRLAAVPVAYAGRRAAGYGKRLLGKPAAEIDRDIQLRTAEHLVEVLGDLKGCLAKLGQMAAVFRSAVPLAPAAFGEIAGETLSRLQDSAPPMMPALVEQVMARNLGPSWRNQFREFTDRAAAAASLGQVHRAVWHDGRDVAVKIMYPGAREAVASDLRQLRSMSGLIGAVMPGADVCAVIEMVCAVVDGELDYRLEAANQQRCADLLRDDPEFLVPDVVMVADEVLISDWLEGAALTRVVATGTAEERGRAGLTVFRFLETVADRGGILYSDVHPGNFLLLPDGRLGVVDFGAVGGYPPDFRATVADIAEALLNGTPADLEDALRAHGFVHPGTAFDAEELLRIATPFIQVVLRDDFHMSTDWLRDQVTDIAAISLSNVFRQMTLPPALIPLARKAGTTVGTLSLLGTDGIRGELLSWYPEIGDAVRRYEDRVSGPLGFPGLR